ncbi:MAG: hypothetical protein R3A44_43390 [Caldilineaceae bacterium]
MSILDSLLWENVLTEKRLTLVVSIIFCIALLIAFGLGMYVDEQDFRLAIINNLLQFAAVIVIGGFVGALFKMRERFQAKDDAILRAQSKLLDDIATTILTYETIAADVTWFKTEMAANDEMHEKAFNRYNERVIDLVAQWRIQAAKAQTLVTPTVSDKINSFLNKVFDEQDTPMMKLYRQQADDEVWQEQHSKNILMIREANKLIEEIAKDLKISSQELHH